MPGWRIDPDSRPRFKELVEDFTIMARDPSRYVFILVRAFFLYVAFMNNQNNLGLQLTTTLKSKYIYIYIYIVCI